LPEKPDVTLRGLVAELAERGIKVTELLRGLAHLRARGHQLRKKPARQRAGPAGRRGQARPLEAPSGPADPARLVFIDETWAKTNMTRSHGLAPLGQRLVAKVPHGRWRNMTFLAKRDARSAKLVASPRRSKKAQSSSCLHVSLTCSLIPLP
jgi:hypothetical protein